MNPPASSPDKHDDLRSGARMLLSPWLVWSAHFAFCYVWLAVRCRPTLIGREWAGLPVADLGVWVASLLATVLLLWMIGDAVRAGRAGERLHGISPALRIGSAMLALVGVAWATLPMVLLAACGP